MFTRWLFLDHSLYLFQLYQRYAVAFDLPDIKLLCLHVSEHRDESVVRPIWNQIFDESMYPIILFPQP